MHLSCAVRALSYILLSGKWEFYIAKINKTVNFVDLAKNGVSVKRLN
jgi:hypothetical protein